MVLPLAVGGVKQGLGLVNANVEFMTIVKATLVVFRVSTMGELLIAVGNLFFLLNITALMARHYRAICVAGYAEATARLEPAEAKP